MCTLGESLQKMPQSVRTPDNCLSKARGPFAGFERCLALLVHDPGQLCCVVLKYGFSIPGRSCFLGDSINAS